VLTWAVPVGAGHHISIFENDKFSNKIIKLRGFVPDLRLGFRLGIAQIIGLGETHLLAVPFLSAPA
jgi:hypothetical protein